MKPTLLLLLIATALAGCSSPKYNYYTLSSPEILAGTTPSHITRIVVGPVTVPTLVDNPQLVVKNSINNVTVYEYQRWAGSLKTDIERVVAADLARDLSTPNVWSYTQSPIAHFDYQVLIDVQNIESKFANAVTLDVLWTVKPRSINTSPLACAAEKTAKPTKTTHVLQHEVTGRSVVREQVTGDGFEALVAAQSRAFDQVSREIAKAIPQ